MHPEARGDAPGKEVGQRPQSGPSLLPIGRRRPQCKSCCCLVEAGRVLFFQCQAAPSDLVPAICSQLPQVPVCSMLAGRAFLHEECLTDISEYSYFRCEDVAR